MTNWKLYNITRVENKDNWVRFHLDDYVSYSDGNHSYITCENRSPYANIWQLFLLGKAIEIEIDNNKTHYYSKIKIISMVDPSALRINLEKKLDEQKLINRELVLMLNNFSQRMISESFTSSSYFTEYDLPNCRQKLNRIFDETEINKEKQTALVTKNSTDISVIQVANLSLQQQVGEKTQLINAGAITLQTTQSQLTIAQNQNQQKDIQITQLNNDLTTTRNQVGQFNTQIVTKDNQITQVTNERNTANEQLTLTRGQLEDLRTLFNNLEIANNNKEQLIKQKEEILRVKEKEIIELRTQLGLLSPEEVLNKKLASGEEELDDLVCTLSLPRQTIKNLRFAYKNLEFNTKVQYNPENIANIDNNIEEIKEELSIFFVENNKDRGELHKIYRSCEQIAKWKVELEQLYQQQYQARQEQPNK